VEGEYLVKIGLSRLSLFGRKAQDFIRQQLHERERESRCAFYYPHMPHPSHYSGGAAARAATAAAA
jgi:hypothetical protein